MNAEMPADHHGRRKIGRSASVALDNARSSAAIYFVLHHVTQAKGLEDVACSLTSFGQEVVILFFLLSGFLIYANEKARLCVDLQGYVVRRVRRIYPPLVVAIGISSCVGLFDQRYGTILDWRSLVGTVLALQDVPSLKPGDIGQPYGGITPLWSLSHKIIFYPLSRIAVIGSPGMRGRTHLFGAIGVGLFILCTFRSNHLLLVGACFLIWWAGAIAAHMYVRRRSRFRDVATGVGWLYALALVAGVSVLASGYAGPGVYPFLMLQHVLIVALLVTVLYGLFGWGIVAHPPERIGWVSFAASISNGINRFFLPTRGFMVRFVTRAGLAGAKLLAIGFAYLFDRLLLQVMTSRTSAHRRSGSSKE